MLRSIVIVILELTIGLTICAAINTQVISYDDVPNITDFDPSPFEKIGDNYYLIETTKKLNWFVAAHQCRKKGANLASIESEDEMWALQKHLIAKYPDHEWFWLSGNDLGEENHFQWLSTGQSMEYTNWSENEPNNAGNENCVHIRYEKSGDFKFNDIPCNLQTNYICEADNPKQISIVVW